MNFNENQGDFSSWLLWVQQDVRMKGKKVEMMNKQEMTGCYNPTQKVKVVIYCGAFYFF